MAVLLSGPSALKHLRNERSRLSMPCAPNPRETPNSFDAPTIEHKNIARKLLGHNFGELHFIVPNATQRRTADDTHCSVHSRPFPRGSFYQVNGDIYCLSPERLFLQMHDHLSDIACIDLGHELCGTYARCGTDHVVHGLPPVTSTSKIKRYLLRCSGNRHVKRALINLGCVNDNSSSLRETHLAMLLCLPTRYGGGGLPKPVLNMPIDVSPQTNITWRNDLRWTDIGWKDARLGVEYDSNEFHSGSEKIAKDAERRILLMAAGYEIIVVTNDQFKRLREIQRVIAVIYRLLGLRQRCRTEGYLLKQQNLHRDILELSFRGRF